MNCGEDAQVRRWEAVLIHTASNLHYFTIAQILGQLAEHALLRQVEAAVDILQWLFEGSCANIFLVPKLIGLIV